MNENTDEAIPPTLYRSDLERMLQLIDECTRRGAFEGYEMSSVGALRDKLSLVIDFYARVPGDEGATNTVTPSAGGPEETSE